jgi:hypothetical protein
MPSMPAPGAAGKCGSADPCDAVRRRTSRSGATPHDRRPTVPPKPARSNSMLHRQGGTRADTRADASNGADDRCQALRRQATGTVRQPVRRHATARSADRDHIAPAIGNVAGHTSPIALAPRGPVQSGFNDVALRAPDIVRAARPHRSLQIPPTRRGVIHSEPP